MISMYCLPVIDSNGKRPAQSQKAWDVSGTQRVYTATIDASGFCGKGIIQLAALGWFRLPTGVAESLSREV